MGSQKKLEELINQYLPPENCKKVCQVRINEQIFKLLQPHTQFNDAKHTRKQTREAKGMIALMQAIDEVQKKDGEKIQSLLQCN